MGTIINLIIWAFFIVLIVWFAQFIVGIVFYAIGMFFALVVTMITATMEFIKRGLGAK